MERISGHSSCSPPDRADQCVNSLLDLTEVKIIIRGCRPERDFILDLDFGHLTNPVRLDSANLPPISFSVTTFRNFFAFFPGTNIACPLRLNSLSDLAVRRNIRLSETRHCAVMWEMREGCPAPSRDPERTIGVPRGQK